eukprot:6808806-Pyramimonas_sp.AAC.1
MLAGDGLGAAAKSAMACSNLQDSKFSAGHLKRKVLVILPVALAPHLGADVGAGRRARTTARKRAA